VAICPKALDDLYVVLGERRAGAERPAGLAGAGLRQSVGAADLPGAARSWRSAGVVSLSDRRLRFGVARKVETAA
jgi:cytochrome c-type biogenesis protein CcmF